MFPLLGGIASGILGLVGGTMSNSANAKQAANQMDFQAGQSQQQMDFGREMAERQETFQRAAVENQEEFQRSTINSAQDYATQMANTSWQRGTADMRAAGINPMLAYSQGGASSPVSQGGTGASAPGATASVSAQPGARAQIQDALSPAIRTAFQGASIATQLEQLAANVEQTQAQTNLVRAQEGATMKASGLTARQIDTEAERPANVRAGTTLYGADTRLRGAQTRTEAERPDQVRADTLHSIGAASSAHAQAQRHEQETHDLRSYGRGVVGNTVSGVSQVTNSIFEAIRDAFRGR